VTCPSEEELAVLLEGELGTVERSTINRHIELCSECQLLWRRLMGSSTMGNLSENEIQQRAVATQQVERPTDPVAAAVDQALLQSALHLSCEEDSLTLHEGLRLGRYLLHEPLGQGGMGVVWRADDCVLTRPVAIKFVTPLLVGDQDVRARFKREAQAVAALDHPSIGAIYEVGEHNGRPYLVMAYYEGGTLRQGIERGVLKLDEAVALLTQLADALATAHSAGIVHRDVKPANVLLTAGGAKLIDFGLAKWVGRDESLTSTGKLIGTLAYMAPEQMRREPIDQRVDVWALGVIGVELLCGSRPFAGTTSIELANAVLSDEPTLPPGMPRDLTAILLTCLDKNPAGRYADAGALATDLRRFSSGQPVAVRRWFWLERIGRRVAAHRLALTLGTLALLALGTAGVQIVGRRASVARIGRAHQLAAQLQDQVSSYHRALLLPLHDITPDRRALQEAVATLERELPRVAPEGTATAKRSIAAGALALNECGKARSLLAAAWDAGEQAPEVAWLLGTDLACILSAQQEDLLSVSDPKLRAARETEIERTLREPAIGYFRLAYGTPGVSSQYVDASLAYHERRYQDAIAAAHRAFAEQPSLFEAGRLEAMSYAALGDAAESAGRVDEAQRLREIEDQTWGRVLEVGRSDAESYLSYARSLMVRANGLYGKHDELYDRIDELCRRALAIDPASTLALIIQSRIWWRRGDDAAAKAGADPRPLLERRVDRAASD
jgi:hypothetical protein